jgi:putative copper export protein
MYQTVLIFHILAATIWTGGHIVLIAGILPGALIDNDIERIISFEAAYEKIGIPALLIQIMSGLWMAHQLIPDVSAWFEWDNTIARLIMFKLLLLLMTASLAVDARLRLIPRLTIDTLTALAWHIIPVTMISILFVIVGVGFRFGGF